MRIVMEPTMVTIIDWRGDEHHFGICPEQYRWLLSALYDGSFWGEYPAWELADRVQSVFQRFLRSVNRGEW